MKVKHNKKRNTAFLFDALTREMASSLFNRRSDRTQNIKAILQEHFQVGSTLHRELDCYDAIGTASGLDKYTAEKLVFHAKKNYEELDAAEIFNEQSAVIRKINMGLGKSFFNTFVPNYKEYATLSSIFGNKIPLKSKMLLESHVVETLMKKPEEKISMKPVDTLVVGGFCERFNEKYKTLRTEQKNLLQKYIFSFGPNTADFKLHVGTELGRLYDAVETSLHIKEVKNDNEMVKNTEKVLHILEQCNVASITEEHLLKILKVQDLVHEYNENADQD